MDEKSLWDWAAEPSHAAYTFHVSDRFGDFGLTGLASISLSGNEARVVDFVMSCRIMGKKIEEALLGYTLARAKDAGADRFVAPLVDGPRNGPAKAFFAGKFASSEVTAIDSSLVGIPPQIRLTEEG